MGVEGRGRSKSTYRGRGDGRHMKRNRLDRGDMKDKEYLEGKRDEMSGMQVKVKRVTYKQ